MSSYRSKRSKGSGSSYYPTQWSEWEWNEQYKCHSRYRLKGPDDYEFDYDQVQSPTFPRTTEEPASLDPIPETYPSQQNYTTSPDLVSSLTHSLAQTSLGPSAGSYTQQEYTSYIKTRNPFTDREEFDPHYKVHGAWEFKWGRIFKVLWAEPKGATGAGSTGASGSESVTVRKGKHGEETYAKVRRFVIIRPLEGHCICLPILTYSGQGVNKRGVHAEHHAIIYSGRRPVALRGEKEKGLTMRSVRVVPDTPRHKLDDASRLNYAKPYTVEYNVKVWFIGKVHHESEWQIRTDYNRVNPPLEVKGLRPPDIPEDTYQHAQGGASAYSGGYNAFSSSTYSATPYPGGTSYTQSGSSGYGNSGSYGSSGGSYTMNATSSSSTGYGHPAYYGSSSHASQQGEERYEAAEGEHEQHHEDESQQHRGGYRGSAGDEHEESPHQSQEQEEEEVHEDIYDP